MKVILLKDVSGVGRRGDIKDVSEGYARNFLLRQKLAEVATEARIAELGRQIESKKSAEAKHQVEMEKLSRKLGSLFLEFNLKADKSGSVFGSVSERDIVQEIKNKTGIEVPESAVKIGHHLKKVGEHEVELKLLPDLKAKVRVKIQGV